MEYVAIGIGLIGLLLAWIVKRKNSDLKEKIAQVNSRVYNLRREMLEAQEKSDQELMRLKFELLKLQGDLAVTPDMKIGEVIAIHPQAQHVLAGFHIGGCASCVVDEQQSLGEAVAGNGRELEPVLAALNTLIVDSSHSSGAVSPERLKTPNVQLQF